MLIILQLEYAASVSFRSLVSEGGTPLGPWTRWEVIKNVKEKKKKTKQALHRKKKTKTLVQSVCCYIFEANIWKETAQQRLKTYQTHNN